MQGAAGYERWMPELVELIEIRSVGADPELAGEMTRAADWLVQRFEAIGGSARIERDGRESVVVADVAAQTESPTTLVIYGHFDVQPVGDLERWTTPPFDPEIRDGWLYARGSVDTKGHLLMYLEALRAVLARGELAVNLRFVIDGAEESGGVLALELLRGMRDEVDACLIFDGPMIEKGRPAFYGAARGMLSYLLTVRTGARDLHSGQFGGAAMNAIHVLTRLLAAVEPGPDGSLHDSLRVGAVPLPKRDADQLPILPSAADLLGKEGSSPADEHVAANLYHRLWAEPSLEVNGVSAGETRLVHMVIPAEAQASLSMRLAPGQDPETVDQALRALLAAATPQGATLTVELRGSSPAALLADSGTVLDVAREAFAAEFGAEPITIRAGGTLPLLGVLGELGIPTVMTGLDLPEGNIHAPDERLWLEYLPAGTRILETILADPRFGQMKFQ